MKANEIKCLPFLKKTAQFQIPIYQRPYSWTEQQCRQLWQDILRSGADDTIDSHFIGSVVYVHDGVYQNSEVPRLLVIDGQQRLTTLSLLILALSDELAEREADECPEGLDPAKLRNYHLVNPQEEGEDRYKLLLTYSDRETLRRLVDGQNAADPGINPSPRVIENYARFGAWLGGTSRDELAAVHCGLGKLMMIDVSLDREHDDPQLIFESLNSTGLALSQADLIRNYVLMGLPPADQKRLFEDHWQPMERAFGVDAYANHFDKFVRHFLTMHTRQIPKIRQVYRAFKNYCQGKDTVGVAEVVATLHRFAGYYTRIACVGPSPEPDRGLRRTFMHLERLQVDTAVPFLMEVYDDYAQDIITLNTAAHIVRLIESYVFRRVLCDVPTNTLNQTFASLATRIVKSDDAAYQESLEAVLLMMSGSRRFPGDAEVAEKLQVKDVYSLRTRDYALEKLENYRRKEPVRVDDFTVEHVLPQNPKLPRAWREALGEDWKEEQARLLHTLGNLTLTRYNSELRDHPFLQKREHEGGFANSPLWLNKSLSKLERWDASSIEARTRKLAKRAVEVWVAPRLDDAVLEKYRDDVESERDGDLYTLDDQPLLVGKMRELFDLMDQQIAGIDERIRRGVKKQYIAYSLDANIVCVIPQKRAMKLYLNVPPALLDDPAGLVKDVTGRGHWGTGDSMVWIRKEMDIDAVMPLVRQSYFRHGGYVA